MAENFTSEIYDVEELTVPVTVPAAWAGAGPAAVRGILSSDYRDISLGESGQDGVELVVRLPLAAVPNVADTTGTITVDGVAYQSGPPRLAGRVATIPLIKL